MTTQESLLASIGTAITPVATNILLTDLKELPPQFTTPATVVAFDSVEDIDYAFGQVTRWYTFVIAVITPRNGDINFSSDNATRLVNIRNELFPLKADGTLRSPLLPSQPFVNDIKFGEVVGQDWSKYTTNCSVSDLGLIVQINEAR